MRTTCLSFKVRGGFWGDTLGGKLRGRLRKEGKCTGVRLVKKGVRASLAFKYRPRINGISEFIGLA